MLKSLGSQTRPPDEILLVDDGSSDRSVDVAHAFARERANVRLLQRPPHPRGRDRLAGAHELDAFQWALGELAAEWDVVAKLDADLKLPPLALGAIVEAFHDDPRLGVAGMFLSEENAEGVAQRIRIASDHVHGATKFYRRDCWNDIAPLPTILGWDTIDEVRARLHGWRTRSVPIPGRDPVHLRPRGAHDGVLPAYRRWGACAWGIGEHPLHVVFWAARESRARPRVLGALNYLAGWSWSALRRRPRAEKRVRTAVRAEQRRRLARRLRSIRPSTR